MNQGAYRNQAKSRLFILIGLIVRIHLSRRARGEGRSRYAATSPGDADVTTRPPVSRRNRRSRRPE